MMTAMNHAFFHQGSLGTLRATVKSQQQWLNKSNVI